MKETIILTNFEFSSTIIGKVSHLSGGFSGWAARAAAPLFVSLRGSMQQQTKTEVPGPQARQSQA